GLVVWLVDARQMKYVPGRKSDVQDCQWLQKLMSLGLLRAAWRPGDEVCVVRAIVRQRALLLSEQASWVQRMQKALLQMNIQLAEVLTDVMGLTGQAIIRDIVAGQRDPAALAQHRRGRVKASVADIQRALTGNWRDEHLFVLTQALAMYDSLAQRLLECDTKLEALLAPLARQPIELARAGNRHGKKTPGFDPRTALARWAGVDLTRINGLAVTSVLTVLSEIGPDLSLRQRQALLLVAGTVSRHQDQRRQSPVGAHTTLDQSGAPSAQARRDEPIAQRALHSVRTIVCLCARMVKP